MNLSEHEFTHLLKSLSDIGVLLSKEKDHSRLLQTILIQAISITNADAGTIYTCEGDVALKFEIVINKSMGIHLGGTSGAPCLFENLPLYDKKGNPNNKMLAAAAVLDRKTIKLEDAYSNTTYDLSGTKKFDKKTGYHSQSFITVPMMDHLDEVIGVLQLINALDSKTKKIIPFTKLDQQLVESLASQAAVTITNRRLIEGQKELFDSFIQLVAKAIDEKSPYTGNHCRRVPVIARMLADAVCKTDKGPYQSFSLSSDEIYELEVAAWLHDCGKISTPEAVVDKATKLEGIHDNIQLIETRFEVLKRDMIIEDLEQQLQALQLAAVKLSTKKQLQNKLKELDEQRDLLRVCNIGKEVIDDEHIKAINAIAKQTWLGPSGKKEPLLSEQEVEMLKISRGTLSDNEREIINNHVRVTLKMLESLPYPRNLKHVAIYAGAHHEKMDGTGYPKRLAKEQLPVQARIIAIADIFEALTSAERPYKKAMTLSQALSILGKMKLEGHIDPDLFDVFMDAKIYEQFARDYLDPTVVDKIDLSMIPGYAMKMAKG